MTSEQEARDALPGCWWHPNRQTGLRCVRCDRPACPDCLRDASVGYQCVDCVQAATAQQRAKAAQYRKAGYGSRTVAGARLARQAVVTPTLIAVNALVYVVTAVQAQSPMENGRSELFREGFLWTPGVVVNDEWWRLLTSGFLHYGLLHLAMNMFALWIIGRDLELLLGKVRFAALYFVSLLGGSAAVFLFEPDLRTATAGASGAVYGLLGALLIAVLKLRLNPTFAIGIIVVNLVISVSIPGISLLGHLGGLVVGALVMAAMLYAPERRRVAYQAGAVAILTVALLGLILYRDAQLADQFCSAVGLAC